MYYIVAVMVALWKEKDILNKSTAIYCLLLLATMDVEACMHHLCGTPTHASVNQLAAVEVALVLAAVWLVEGEHNGVTECLAKAGLWRLGLGFSVAVITMLIWGVPTVAVAK